MIRAPRSIIAVALAGITSITSAFGTVTASSTTAFPTSPSTIGVDVIFPIHNATYNITESLPIVFALQNLTAAAALGPFSFGWDIMPYGRVGEDQEPGGVTNDFWSTSFTTANATAEPYILVNQTNVQKWEFGPWFPNGSVYALQWAISWDNPTKVCDSNPLGVFGTLFFNINLDSPEPDLGNLTGQCPQLGGAYEIDTSAKNSSCSAVASDSSSGDPCAVTLDKAMVGTISSDVQSLITASAAVASASAASASAAWASITAVPHKSAASFDAPFLSVLLATFLGSLQVVIFN